MNKLRKIILLSLCGALALSLSACSLADSASDPKTLIQNAFGNTEFKITFNSEGLDEPLADMYYTSQKIPKLPTPEKLGYIFEGWYFDSAFTQPYEDRYLLLYMCDITLYAKWTKEDMVQAGVYEIGFSAAIVEGSVRNTGELVGTYGYADFCNAIIEDQTYIEKTDDELLLKIQYDAGSVVPINSSPVFSVALLSPYTVKASPENTVDSAADTEKAIYFNIDNFDITESIFFTVTSYNWETEGLSYAQRMLTAATYTVEFKITKFIGFSQAFVNTDVTLEDGYYLVKSYYQTTGGESSMAQSFNPVFSYLVAEKGKYTFIKQYSPFIGMMTGSTADNFSQNINNLFDRGTVFSTIGVWYGVTVSNDGSSYANSQYLPSYFNGGYYGGYSVEFHADTGKFYAVYEFGETLYSEVMLSAAMTGYMEYAGGMGTVDLVMVLDLDHVIRLAETDYVPLTGEAYQYADTMQFYGGRLDDLNEYNLTYAATEEYGLNSRYINFFWEAVSADVSYSQRTVLSSRVTVTPTAATAATKAGNSRYTIAHFDITGEVFGYDATGGKNLYADVTRVGAFNGKSLRVTQEIRQGMSLGVSEGTEIRLQEVYAQKVDANGDFSQVDYKVYRMKDGAADFSAQVSYAAGGVFDFREAVAVLFTGKDGSRTTLVEIVAEQSPEITVEEGTYDGDRLYTIKDSVVLPVVSYSWLGATGSFTGSFYEGSSPKEGVDPTAVAMFSVTGSLEGQTLYSLSYFSIEISSFTVSAETMIAVYELTNRYGERYLQYFTYRSQQQQKYVIYGEGEEGDRAAIAVGTISYGADGTRTLLNLSASDTPILSAGQAGIVLAKTYEVAFGENSPLPLTLVAFTVRSRDLNVRYTDLSDAERIINGALDLPYAYVSLEYRNEAGDRFIAKYLSGVTLDGKTTYTMLDYPSVFSEYAYSVRLPQIVTADEVILGSGSVSVYRVDGDSESYVGAVYSSSTVRTFTFPRAGTYKIKYNVSMDYDADGVRIFGGYDYVNVTFTQTVEVVDGKGTVTVIYHTDDEHPFLSTLTAADTFVLTHDLAANNGAFTPIGQQYFSYSGTDKLFGWVTTTDYTYRDINKVRLAESKLNSYISTFHAQTIHLYPIWDAGVVVTAEPSVALDGLKVIHLSTNSDRVRLYLSADTVTKGKYVVKFSQFQVSGVPSGYEFIGWTVNGTFVPAAEANDYTYTTTDNENFTVTAEIRRVYTAYFSIDQKIFNTFFQPMSVYEGQRATEPWAVEVRDPSKYRFVGWYVLVDGEYVKEDGERLLVPALSEYEITGDVTFEAAYEEIGGNS